MSVPYVHISCPRIVLFLNWCHHKSCLINIFLFPLPVLPVCHKFVHSTQVCVPNFKTQVKVKFYLSPLILCGKVASHTSPLFHVSQHHVLEVR